MHAVVQSGYGSCEYLYPGNLPAEILLIHLLPKPGNPFQAPSAFFPGQIVPVCLPTIVARSSAHHFGKRQHSGKDVQVGDFVFGLVPKADEGFEEEKFSTQVRWRLLAFWNREGLVLYLQPVRHNLQVVAGRVNGNTDMHPRKWHKRGRVGR